MNKQSNVERVWDIIEKVGVCMLTTQFAGGLRAGPTANRACFFCNGRPQRQRT
jgi:hypothetical protein